MLKFYSEDEDFYSAGLSTAGFEIKEDTNNDQLLIVVPPHQLMTGRSKITCGELSKGKQPQTTSTDVKILTDHLLHNQKYGLGYNPCLPKKIKVKKVSSNPIMIQIYETVEDKLKESRPSVFDRIQNKNVRVSVFERLERETSTIVNPRGRMSVFQRLSGDSSTFVQVDKDAQASSESSQRQSIFSRLVVKTSNSCLKPQ
ncbi:Uncharacterized protein Adt_40252 [Abeliophyllum distichum]|uniref:Uncharacterized protein n=1 Tax=Abeliophyllum distichum TaxID=126358 RepID=A0ABD1Q7F2_9LAMI